MKKNEIGKVENKYEAPAEIGSWLFIIPSLAVGGSEKKTVMIANELAARNYDVHLVYLKKPDHLSKMVSSQVNLMMLGRKSRFDISAMIRLRSYIKTNNVTRVWCINLYPMLYGLFSTLLLGRKIKRIVSINTTHFSNIYKVLQMILYVPVIYQMDRIIFGCDMQMRHWLRLYRLPKNKSLVIYNGIDINYYHESMLEYSRVDVRARYGIDNSEVVFGIVARLMPEKDHACAINALNHLIDNGCKVKLMIAGDGRERKSLMKLVNNANMQNDVLFLGDVDDVREVLIAIDVFLLTSISETFSNAALEAMSMSKPVVLSNVGGASEMVEVGKNGYLFESGDTRGLADVLTNVMNPELIEKMSLQARIKVCGEFSFDRMVDDYIVA